jgi:hypothetical protein
MKTIIVPLFGICCAAVNAQDLQTPATSVPNPTSETAQMQVEPLKAKLLAGSPVIVSLIEDISTTSSNIGDKFKVMVVHDVVQSGTIVIPKGALGEGVVTFVTKNGAFGKPGILGISLRSLELNGQRILLDGRYREEGGNNNGAAAATMFAVGVAAALVKGKSSFIPKGRELKARTGEDISFAPVTEPSSGPISETKAPELPQDSPPKPPEANMPPS